MTPENATQQQPLCSLSPKREGYWWLAAFGAPVACGAFGLLFALGSSTTQSDWFGMGRLVPAIIGLLAGSILSCAAAFVSFLNREANAPASLFAALPAFLSIVWAAWAYHHSEADRKHQIEINAQYYKQQKEDQIQNTRWRDELHANPELITSDAFWLQNKDHRRTAELGLRWLIQDKTFAVTPEIRNYVLKNFPDAIFVIFQSDRFDSNELKAIARDKHADHRLRDMAVDSLLRDTEFEVSGDWRKFVVEEFPAKASFLFGRKKFTKAELEAIVLEPKTPNWIKEYAQKNLHSGYFQAAESETKR